MSEVLEVQVVPSEEVNKVPDVPTATNETLEVVVLLSSLLLQEITVRLIMVIRITHLPVRNIFLFVVYYLVSGTKKNNFWFFFSHINS